MFLIAHDFAAGYNARDAGMAYAFHVLRGMKAPGAKTVVWAANSHVARHELPRGERPIGSHLADAFGDGYVTFALAAHHTEIDFPGFGCGPVRRTPGSIEDKLAVLDEDALLVDTRTRFLRRGNSTMGLDVVRPQREYNGTIYLRQSGKMRPVWWLPCR